MNLAIGFVFLLLLIGANVAGVRHPLVYSILGIGGLWLAFLQSGVHATIAGVLAAMTIPAYTRLTGHEFLAKGKALLDRFAEVTSPDIPPLANRERQRVTRRLEVALKHVETPLQRLEHALHPWVTVVVMPVFALANAGLALDGNLTAALANPVVIGVMLGLLIGKPVGIVGATWLTVRSGAAQLPEGVSWRQLLGVGCVAGIGFTMSLFIAGLAFEQADLLRSAKMGILFASTMAGTLGWAILRGVRFVAARE
jgi:NhaA family Na+:H+ antiporter